MKKPLINNIKEVFHTNSIIAIYPIIVIFLFFINSQIVMSQQLQREPSDNSLTPFTIINDDIHSISNSSVKNAHPIPSPSTTSQLKGLEEWQKEGIRAAFDDPDVLVKLEAWKKVCEWLNDKNNPIIQEDARIIAEEQDLRRIICLLENKDPEVCLDTIDILGRIAGTIKLEDKYIFKIIDLLGNQYYEIREKSAKALENIAKSGELKEKFIKQIILLLGSNKAMLRMSAIHALGNIGRSTRLKKIYIDSIIMQLESRDYFICENAVYALQDIAKNNKFDDKQMNNIVKYLDRIIAQLEKKGYLVRSHIFEALGNLAEDRQLKEQHIKKIVSLVENKNTEIQIESIKILVRGGKLRNSYIEKIINYTANQSEDIQKKAIDTLEIIVKRRSLSERYINKIIKFLVNLKFDSTYSIIDILGSSIMNEQIESQEKSIQRIASMLDSKDPNIQRDAMGILVNIAKHRKLGEIYINKIVKLLDSTDKRTIRSTLYYLCEIAEKTKIGEKGVNQIVELVECDDPEIQISAIVAISKTGRFRDEYVTKLINLSKNSSPFIQKESIDALGKIAKEGKIKENGVKRIIECLEDEDFQTRHNAIWSLDQVLLNNKFQNECKRNISIIAEMLKDDNNENKSNIRIIIGKIGCLGREGLISIIATLYSDKSDHHKCRFLAHYVGGGKKEAEILIQWLGKYEKSPIEQRKEEKKRENQLFSEEESRQILKVFSKVWKESKKCEGLHKELATAISKIIVFGTWEREDIKNLKFNELKEELESENFTAEAAQISAKINELNFWHRVLNEYIIHYIMTIILPSVFLWILAFIILLMSFILFYERFPIFQNLLRMDSKFRKFVGMGFFSFIIINYEWFRKKYFSPLLNTLIHEAYLKKYDENSYFKNIEFTEEKQDGTMNNKKCFKFINEKNENDKESEPIIDWVKLKGTIVIEGDSGLGKTMFLKYLVSKSNSIAVFLNSNSCKEGVIEAISLKLDKLMNDTGYLKAIVKNGYMEIYIDGLNEASPETRVKISNFIKDNPKGNYILTTQKIGWTSKDAMIYEILPLSQKSIKEFLNSRFSTLEGNERSNYLDTCNTYLNKIKEIENSKDTEDLKKYFHEILSNPMDLTTISELLKDGEVPDLTKLQKQKFDLVCKEYKEVCHGEKFPIEAFSVEVFKMLGNRRMKIPFDASEAYSRELDCLLKYNMVNKVEQKNAQGKQYFEWFIRHERIRDFFAAQIFMENKPVKDVLPQGYYEEEKEYAGIQDYFLDDKDEEGKNRYFGVYMLLATMIESESEVDDLEKRIHDYMIDTEDQRLYVPFVKCKEMRKSIKEIQITYNKKLAGFFHKFFQK